MAYLATVSLLVLGTVGVRVVRQNQTGSPAVVAGVWPMGSPQASSPALINPRSSDGCFPGMRSWACRKQWWGNECDLVTSGLGLKGFRHIKSAGAKFDDKKNTIVEYPCSDEVPNLPRGSPKVIHDWDTYYVPAASTMGPLLNSLSHVGIPSSYKSNEAEVSQLASRYGWNLIGTGVGDGGGLYVGDAISHLIKQAGTGVCMLTFQGTDSLGDWVANTNTAKAHFCGLVEPGETCRGSSICRVNNYGSSFVHKGFRDVLRKMVRSDSWQSNVHSKLSSCSQVHVVGHSLGGATAELFTACANRHLTPGQYGYEDYKYIGWNTR